MRFWTAPVVIILALMSALAALYLGGILNPTTNLRQFPIALVNEDAGPPASRLSTASSPDWTRTNSMSGWSTTNRPSGCWTGPRSTARR
ncbi:conserved transmembrane domain protein [Mycobacterium ulcerans str. Harvey]|uniref:Conserved transmembrane domain protein n=1 Tax=Mycobacterium ulcerans str. Harvey TaxID=1299332 RepID=A0ABP3ALI4_MYCUL|nr:conserved transmembrane domain protein [Mycobacterium ulcerans str. Harvey]